MKTLTARQQAVLDFVRQTIDRTALAPTLREIAAHFRFRSVKAAADHVAALRRKGALESQPRCARALRVVPVPDAPDTPAWTRALGCAIARLPVYGSIPAGRADDRRQETRGCVAVDLDLLGLRPTPRTFALEVRGDSMIGRHILEGDLVVLEHGKSPRPGDVVAALIDNESTLKTYVQEPGRSPYLKAENPRYPTLHPVAELVIQGVMVGLIRKT
jgi:repressor LexA